VGLYARDRCLSIGRWFSGGAGCWPISLRRQQALAVQSRQGVDEYWIVDWRAQTVQVYRRAGPALLPAGTLATADTLASPLLPGFAASAGDLCAPAL